MKAKETSEFSWTTLFMVTTFCFFAFSGLIKLLNGSPVHIALFITIGFISLGLWFVRFLIISSGIATKKKRIILPPLRPGRTKQ